MAAICTIASRMPPSVTMMMHSTIDALQWDYRKWRQASGGNRVAGIKQVVIFVGWES